MLVGQGAISKQEVLEFIRQSSPSNAFLQAQQVRSPAARIHTAQHNRYTHNTHIHTHTHTHTHTETHSAWSRRSAIDGRSGVAAQMDMDIGLLVKKKRNAQVLDAYSAYCAHYRANAGDIYGI